MTEYFDLSHQIENGMSYFPGDPEPRIEPVESTPPWRVTQLHFGTHIGTHIDAASHFIPHGKTISQYPLERFLLPGIVVPVHRLNDDEETDHAHAELLGNDILIVENLTRLHQLSPGVVYQCSFLPLPLSELDGSPVRAISWRNA